MTVGGEAPAKPFKVSGIATLGDADSFGGAHLIILTPEAAHEVAGYDGWDSISVSTGGKNQDQVKADIQKLLGKDFKVQTGRGGRRVRRPPTSRTRSASSGSRCSCSRAWRCWWAGS